MPVDIRSLFEKLCNHPVSLVQISILWQSLGENSRHLKPILMMHAVGMLLGYNFGNLSINMIGSIG